MSSRSLVDAKRPDPYGPTRTKSIPRAEHDINLIIDRYRKTGQLPPGGSRQPQFADVSEIGDFAAVQRKAKEFLALTEKVMAKEKAKAKAAKPPTPSAASPAPPPVPPPAAGSDSSPG